MDFEDYYKDNRTYITRIDVRLRHILKIISDIKPKGLLDVGCGNGLLLEHIKQSDRTIELAGIDVYEKIHANRPWAYVTGDITKTLPFADAQFDCVVLGEVIEHVPNPDMVLREITRVLSTGGYLVISTPNLVSWANRILVPLGIQPLFTETSSEVNLGRHLKILGQGGKVQGHLKIFTHRSLEEILARTGFVVKRKIGAPFFFPFPISLIDMLCCHFISLSSDLIYLARKQ